MTTIAYRDGVLAADSQRLYGGYFLATVEKVIKTSDGVLVGTCGDANLGDHFKRWARDGFVDAGKPDFSKIDGADMAAITVHPEGFMRLWTETMIPEEIPHGMFSLGTGDTLAMGAMLMGASAIKAVEMAIVVDSRSGGAVRSVMLDANQIRAAAE